MIPLLLGAVIGACLFGWMLSGTFKLGLLVWSVFGGCLGATSAFALSPLLGYEGHQSLQTQTYALTRFHSADGPFIILQGDGTYIVDTDPMPGIQRLPAMTYNIFFDEKLQEEQREDGIAIVTTSTCDSHITLTTICWRKEVTVIYRAPEDSILDLLPPTP